MTSGTFDYRPLGEGPSEGFMEDGGVFKLKRPIACKDEKAAQSMEHAVRLRSLSASERFTERTI